MSIEAVTDIAQVFQPDPAGGYKVIGQDASELFVPVAAGNRHYSLVQEWLTSNSLDEEVYAPSLAEAQVKRIDLIKNEAWSLLHLTDWYDVRAAAGGSLTPANIAAYRQAVRDATQLAEDDINALTTINEVRDYTFTWPIVP